MGLLFTVRQGPMLPVRWSDAFISSSGLGGPQTPGITMLCDTYCSALKSHYGWGENLPSIC